MTRRTADRLWLIVGALIIAALLWSLVTVWMEHT